MKQRILAPSSDQVLQATAYHEAGHAVIAYRLRMCIEDRDIVADSSGHGKVHYRSAVQPELVRLSKLFQSLPATVGILRKAGGRSNYPFPRGTRGRGVLPPGA
jgi:hypothetical protein